MKKIEKVSLVLWMRLRSSEKRKLSKAYKVFIGKNIVLNRYIIKKLTYGKIKLQRIKNIVCSKIA